jgi:chromosome segregation ATPase
MLALASISLAIFSTTAAFLYFRRAAQLRNLLLEGGRLYDEQLQSLGHQKARVSALESELAGLKIDCHKARTAYLEVTTREAAQTSEFLHTQTTLERRLANAELQRDHILARYEAMQTAQDDTLQSERDKTIQITRQAAEKNERIHAENSDLRRRVGELDRELTQLKSTPSVDQRTFETVRRRAAHNEQLFHSMKSLRDMADERNKNWESALRSLSTWILTSSPLAKPNDPILTESIGPIVGEALQRIGGRLMTEDESTELAAEKRAMDIPDSVAGQAIDPSFEH